MEALSLRKRHGQHLVVDPKSGSEPGTKRPDSNGADYAERPHNSMGIPMVRRKASLTLDAVIGFLNVMT